MRQVLTTICFCFFAVLAFTQQRKPEIIRDTIYFEVLENECGDTVWFSTEEVEFKGGRKFTDSKPVGFNDQDPCAGIKYKDTTTLLNYFANPLFIDRSRQLAEKAVEFIFEDQELRSVNRLIRALKDSGLPNLQLHVEKMYGDSILGTYKFVRPVAGKPTREDCTVSKRPNGNIVVRIGSVNYPVAVLGDKRIEISNIPSNGQKIRLYLINPGRWSSITKDFQMVKNEKLIIETKTVK